MNIEKPSRDQHRGVVFTEKLCLMKLLNLKVLEILDWEENRKMKIEYVWNMDVNSKAHLKKSKIIKEKNLKNLIVS